MEFEMRVRDENTVTCTFVIRIEPKSRIWSWWIKEKGTWLAVQNGSIVIKGHDMGLCKTGEDAAGVVFHGFLDSGSLLPIPNKEGKGSVAQLWGRELKAGTVRWVRHFR